MLLRYNRPAIHENRKAPTAVLMKLMLAAVELNPTSLFIHDMATEYKGEFVAP